MSLEKGDRQGLGVFSFFLVGFLFCCWGGKRLLSKMISKLWGRLGELSTSSDRCRFVVGKVAGRSGYRDTAK